MPQLDKFSFATQLFWFCTLFLIYYLLILDKFLPRLLKVLRFRSLRLSAFALGIRLYLSEEFLTRNSGLNLHVINSKFSFINVSQIQKLYTK